MKKLYIIRGNTINRQETKIEESWWWAEYTARCIRNCKKHNGLHVIRARKSHTGNSVKLVVIEDRIFSTELVLNEKS